MVAGAVGTSLEPGARGVQMVELFVETEVAQIVEAKLVPQEAGKFVVLLEKGVLPIGAEDVMALSTTGGSSPSANWSYFPPILEMPGCSITDQLPHP